VNPSPRVPQIVLLSFVAVLTAATCMAGLTLRAAEVGPGVGDMVIFKTDATAPFGSPERLVASRQLQASCVLDIGMMQKSGGSLVVEERGAVSANYYRVHWAGPRTSEDATNCGADADLVLSKSDLNSLLTATGEHSPDEGVELRLR